MTSPPQSLRRRLRDARRGLDQWQQDAAADAVARRLGPLLRDPPATVAGYIAADGEVRIDAVLKALRDGGTQIVLPRTEGERMSFHVVRSEDDLVAGEWGLTEPRSDTPTVPPTAIEVVLTPLVGFDRDRNRIGRGRGYYDRHFAFLNDDPRPDQPRLIGIAHDLQLVEALPVHAQDVRLDAVVTPSALHGTLR